MRELLPKVGSSVDIGEFGTMKYWIGDNPKSVKGFEVSPRTDSKGKRFYEPVYVEENVLTFKDGTHEVYKLKREVLILELSGMNHANFTRLHYVSMISKICLIQKM